jgi:hypothetical protein
LCQPRVIVKMIVEKQMKCRLAGETEVLGENLPQRHFCPSHNLTWPDPDLNPGRCGGKPATNRLSYGAALICVIVISNLFQFIFINSFYYLSYISVGFNLFSGIIFITVIYFRLFLATFFLENLALWYKSLYIIIDYTSLIMVLYSLPFISFCN